MLPKDEIERLEKSAQEDPRAREAQKALARNVTALVHGEAHMKAVEQVTAVLFGGESVTSLDSNALDELDKEIPTVEKGKQLFDILTETGVASSSSEARRLVAGGAVTVNGEKVSDDVTLNDVSLIKKGKNSFVLVR